MNRMIIFTVLILILIFCFELAYFKIADHFNIIDHPNHRSSHTEVTIRGGGIIFSLALMFSAFYIGFQNIYFLSGLFLISLISFIDDLKTIGSGIRICFHVISVGLLFAQLNVYALPLYLIISAFFISIATINAVNFMDGINGITGAYGLVTLATLAYINKFIINFTQTDLLVVSIASVLVFNFFNFRRKAKCFAGDVGSVGLAFIIIFFILQLILKTGNIAYVLLLALYGLDTGVTLVFRIIRRERLSQAHRSHFYQYLANEKKSAHLLIAAGYAIVQLTINAVIINYRFLSIYHFIIFIIVLGVLFIILRFFAEGSSKLMQRQQSGRVA